MKYAVIQLTSALLIALAIMGVVGVGYLYQPLVKQYLSNQKWQMCAMAYQIEFNDKEHGVVVVSPNSVEVEKCMEGL
jgi:hypothetical protein